MSLLVMSFPQWQGAGAGHEPIGFGALAAASLLPAMLSPRVAPVATVPVASELTGTRDGVHGLPALIDQFGAARRLLSERRPDRVAVIGGDCAAEVVPLAYLRGRYGARLGLVWFDAHLDLNTIASSTSQAAHGMALTMLLGAGETDLAGFVPEPFDPARVVLAGVRACDPPEVATASRLGLSGVGVEELESSSAALIATLRERGIEQVVIHVDVDVLDPAEFGAVGWPAPGGLSVAALTRTLADLAVTFEVVGVGLTEYRPPELAVIRKLMTHLVDAVKH